MFWFRRFRQRMLMRQIARHALPPPDSASCLPAILLSDLWGTL